MSVFRLYLQNRRNLKMKTIIFVALVFCGRETLAQTNSSQLTVGYLNKPEFTPQNAFLSKLVRRISDSGKVPFEGQPTPDASFDYTF